MTWGREKSSEKGTTISKGNVNCNGASGSRKKPISFFLYKKTTKRALLRKKKVYGENHDLPRILRCGKRGFGVGRLFLGLVGRNKKVS